MMPAPAFVPGRHLYRYRNLGSLGMTPEEARQILATGSSSQELLRQAYEVYYGQYYAQQPSVIAAQTGLSYEEVSERIAAGESPESIKGPNQWMAEASALEQAPIAYYPMEQCDPLDSACVARNAQRQQANMALAAERNRQINYATCVANAMLNGRDPDSACAQYADPIPVPPAPGALAYTSPAELERLAQQQQAWIEQQTRQTQPTSSSTPTSTAQVYRPQVSIENTSRPGQALRAGDAFRVRVTGARPGATVEVEAYQDGRSLGRTRYGTTDSAGSFTLTGTIGAEHAGRWREIWHIGGDSVTVEFTVEAPATSTTTLVRLTPGQTSDTRDTDSGSWMGPLASIPTWIWLVAGAAVLWRLMR